MKLYLVVLIAIGLVLVAASWAVERATDWMNRTMVKLTDRMERVIGEVEG